MTHNTQYVERMHWYTSSAVYVILGLAALVVGLSDLWLVSDAMAEAVVSDTTADVGLGVLGRSMAFGVIGILLVNLGVLFGRVVYVR